MAATRIGTSTLASSGGFIRGAQGSTLASATSIVLTDFVHSVGGSATVSAITFPSDSTNSLFALIPAASSAWELATGGNVSEAVTAVVGRPIFVLNDGGTARVLLDARVQGFDGWYNVKDYGAVGDGTADDSAAIQAAMDAANSAGGGVVFYPEGTYLLSTHASGTILTNRSNVTHLGASLSSIIKKGAFGTTDVEVFKGGCSNARWTNLKFDLNGENNLSPASPTVGLMSAIAADSGDNITVDSCWFTNQAGQRVLSFGSAGTQISDLIIRDNFIGKVSSVITGNTNAYDHSSIYLEASRAQVSGNTLSNASQETTASAVEAHGSLIDIHHNIIKNYNIGAVLAAWYSSSSEIAFRDNVLSSCRQFVELHSQTAYTLDEIRVEDNVLATTTSADPLIDLEEQNQVQGGSIYIRRNTIQSSAAESSGLDAPGINVGRMERVVIADNVFEGLTGRPVEFGVTYPITANNTNLYVERNKFIDCCNNSDATYAGTAGRYVVHVGSGVALDDIRIVGNEFINDARSKMERGINVGDNADRLLLRGNYGNVAIIDTVSGTISTAEYHPPKLLDIVRSTADVNVNRASHNWSTAQADITGATTTFTPQNDCRARVVGNFDVNAIVSGVAFFGGIKVNGTLQTGAGIYTSASGSQRVPVTQQWIVNLTAGTAYTIKLVAGTSDSGASQDQFTVYGGSGADHTTMTIELLPRY